MADVLRENPPALTPHRATVTTADGVPIDTALLRGPDARDTAVVLANGFTGTWRSPATRRIARRLAAAGDVLTFDFRGHHASGGECTVGDREIEDVEAAVRHLRDLGYTRVATVGFSLGAAVVVRHAATYGGVRATVAIGGPCRWYYRGSFRMRLLHVGIEWAVGRWFLRLLRSVRVTGRPWSTVPPDPTESASRIAPAALLVVHGDADSFFPVDHAARVYAAAHEPKDLWIEPAMGHAERAMTPACVDRVARWLDRRLADTQA